MTSSMQKAENAGYDLENNLINIPPFWKRNTVKDNIDKCKLN